MQPLERRAWLVAAAAVALVAAAWRFETLARRPLWLDERYTAHVVQKSADLAALWREAAADQNLHPPLAYAPAWLAAHGAESRQSLRMPAAIAGLASIALLAALGTRLFGRWTGLLAAFLMGISVYHVDFSQEARPYMVALAFTLGAYTALFGYLAEGRARQLVGFALAAIGAVYTEHLALAHVAVAAVIATAHTVAGGREARARGRRVALTFAAIALAVLPELPNLIGFASAKGLAANHVLSLEPRVLHALVQRWGSGTGWVTWLYEAAFVLGALRIGARRDLVALGLLGWAAAPFAPFALIPFSKYFDIRFLISALPVFFLAVAGGVGLAAEGARRLATRAALAPRAASACAAAVLASAALAFFVPAAALYQRFRATDVRCGEFVVKPEIIEANERFCAEHLVLSTIYGPHQFIVRNLRPALALDASRLDAYVGAYAFENGPRIEIRRRGDHLTAQREGQFEYDLLPESETRFFYRVLGNGLIEFERDAGGSFDSLLLEGPSGYAHARRMR